LSFILIVCFNNWSHIEKHKNIKASEDFLLSRENKFHDNFLLKVLFCLANIKPN
jgi:COG4688: uncharacterized protein conserved in bacteria